MRSGPDEETFSPSSVLKLSDWTPPGDLVQLSFRHVGRDHRRLGVGTELFEAAQEVAAELGAAGLYVSATPSENTVDFYLRRGCQEALRPDPELLALEPEDVHFECFGGTMPSTG